MTEQQQIGGVEIDAGWTALKAGNWAAAKAVFEESLANGETPEALEGIGAAAQMMNEDPLTFDARERAYRLYLQRGDKGSAARIAAWPVSCTCVAWACCYLISACERVRDYERAAQWRNVRG